MVFLKKIVSRSSLYFFECGVQAALHFPLSFLVRTFCITPVWYYVGRRRGEK